jgi:hypothetical protein
LYLTIPTGARENNRSRAAEAADVVEIVAHSCRQREKSGGLRRRAPVKEYFYDFLTHFPALPYWNSTVK